MANPVKIADEHTGNVFDYARWRGDIPMSVDPFNEADNVVLSLIVYVPFSGIVPGEDEIETVSMREASRKFWSQRSTNDIDTENPALGYSPFLLREISTSRRFGGIKLGSYVSEMNAEESYQFSAITYTLEDGTYYAAFMGTDDSWIGWKEDFNLSYIARTRGQERAVEYLNRHFHGKKLQLRVGGHSKGGNFAIYSCMHAESDIRDRLRRVYSNDGPGFMKSITDSVEYKRIIPRLVKFIPEESLIGILLNTEADVIVIKSTAQGVMQHDPFSWQIVRNRLVRAEERSNSSLFFEKTINGWINSLDPDSRKVFIDALFDSVESSGCTTISEFTGDPVRAYSEIVKTVKSMPKKDQATVLLVLQKLAESGTNQVISNLTDRLSDLTKNF